MDKLTMAHDYAVAMLKTPAQLTGLSDKDIAIAAFNLAEAMQDEADKREVGIAELMKDHVHDYIYGRICACGAVNGAEEEWQPDWSQAPALTTGWFVRSNGSAKWQISHGSMAIPAPLFGYTGHWQNSLRKRPQ